MFLKSKQYHAQNPSTKINSIAVTATLNWGFGVLNIYKWI